MEISPVVRLSCCPSEPPRGLAEIPDVRMFSEQLVKFDPKQSRAKKMGPGRSGHSPQGFHVTREQALPPVRPPSSSTGNHVGSHTRPLVLEVPLYGRLTFPAFPKLSPAEQNTLLSLGCHAIQTLNQPYAAKLGRGVWLMDRSVGP